MRFNVLIVDDEELEREAIRHFLNRGIDVELDIREAESGTKAVSLARQRVPDIVLMDIRMPGLDGLEAAAQIREIHPSSRIVPVTAFDRFENAHKAIKLGVDDFLVKPASEEQVVETVTRIVSEIQADRIEHDRHVQERQELDRLTASLERELVAGLASGAIGRDRVASRLRALSIEKETLVAGCIHIDFERYPMPVTDERQRGILKRRCTRALSDILAEEGLRCLANDEQQVIYLVLLPGGVGTPDGKGSERGLSASLCDDAWLEHAGERVSAALAEIERRLGIVAEYGASRPVAITGDIDICFSEAVDDLRRRSRASNAGNAIQQAESARERERFAGEHRDSGEVGEVGEVGEAGRLLGRSEDIVLRATSFMSRHYMEDVSLQWVADHVSVSSYYLSKLFSMVRGKTFVEVLTEIRVEQACRLLSDSVLSIKQIAERVGYSDSSYFTRAFKRQTGTTPSGFRRNSQNSPVE